ncbi:MAG TPA: stage V sporulation T C-terminal domain-containing protein [Eubacteriales bacterium]|jgi:AbrB family transcriptional regulator (stage V sporulation protein T)|nr:stage V sporulation T C-terminal domain-containing protein [Clostridia bacterium]HRR90383.1 stage V sporulation T C-terminal domain-containing protein [Eubacteriales bacterium]HRU84926.1 stage V sporulation T C-terminal domain-containing protein [Eubacteriales bacterium]
METTGIVRRIDELGRIVIPKEIRRTMRLKEGEELEILMGNDELVFKKFSAVKSIEQAAAEITAALSSILGGTAVITDTDAVISAHGALKRELAGAKISERLEAALAERKPKRFTGAEIFAIAGENTENVKEILFSPIIAGGDLYGSVVFLSPRDNVSMDSINLSAKFLENLCV